MNAKPGIGRDLKGAMPAFPESMISERELNDLTEYVVALRQHGK